MSQDHGASLGRGPSSQRAAGSSGGAAPADRAAARPEAILLAAARTFGENGYDATSMRSVSQAAGASLGSIYYHYKSKEELLRAIICGNLARVQAALESRLEGVEDPRRAIEVFVENHVTFFARHLDEMRVMSHELDTLTGEAGEEVAGLRRAYTGRAEGLLAKLRPDLDASDLRVGALCLFGMLNWTYRWFHTLPTEVDAAGLGRRMAALFLDGFLDRGEVG